MTRPPAPVADDVFGRPLGQGATSTGSLPHDAYEALQRGRVIEAIQLTREATGLGLREAKQLVDAAQGKLPADGVVPGLASEGALFDPRHEPGRVRGGTKAGVVAIVALVLAVVIGFWLF